MSVASLLGPQLLRHEAPPTTATDASASATAKLFAAKAADAFAGLLKQRKALPAATEALLRDAEVVALFFGAKGDPFVKTLLKAFEETRKARPKAFQVVYIAGDADEAAMLAAFSDQPWLALPFAERARREALITRFKLPVDVSVLVLLDNRSGEVIRTDGKEAVAKAPEAFPWRPTVLGKAAALASGLLGKAVAAVAPPKKQESKAAKVFAAGANLFA